MKSKELASKLQIIGDTHLKTKDIQDLITYFDNLVINKKTLEKMNTAELVQNINKLVQCIEVLSIYKQPIQNLLNYYQSLCQKCNDDSILYTHKKELLKNKKFIENLLSKIQIEDTHLVKKESWEKYE